MIEHGNWPVPPNPPRTQGGPVIAELGCVIVTVGVVAAVLFPVFAVPHDPVKSTVCLSNVKRVSIALLLYSQDNNERMPHGKWMDSTFPYTKDWQTYAYPVAHREDEAAYGYGFERTLTAKHNPGIKTPAKEPMVFDCSLLYKNATTWIRAGLMRPGRHGGRDVVGFLDGHTRLFGEQSLSKRWPPP